MNCWLNLTDVDILGSSFALQMKLVDYYLACSVFWMLGTLQIGDAEKGEAGNLDAFMVIQELL